MKIHEYQAKELFESYGVPIRHHVVIRSAEEAGPAAEKIGGETVLKAQVLVGGRGKAGGVKKAKSPAEAVEKAREILALTIKGLPVEKVLVTPASNILKEYYIGFTLDRTKREVILMMSKAGGVDIEELAKNKPDAIIKFPISTSKGIDVEKLKPVLKELFGSVSLSDQALSAVEKLYRFFIEKDCTLVEVNPYALEKGGGLYALDAKVNFDDNALYKHEDIQELKNPEEYSPDEIDARKQGLSFVSMDGYIGCIVNGAGLAMATMDLIKYFGGQPANFLDVGGSSSPEKVLNALRIIMNNKKVKAIIINIFGGITRCDDIAKGILMAMDRIDIDVPLVIRLIGTNEKEGRKMLTDAGFSVAEDLSTAVQKVVSLSNADKGGGK
jgi:succinyl-CoA synthetase beta subunit